MTNPLLTLKRKRNPKETTVASVYDPFEVDGEQVDNFDPDAEPETSTPRQIAGLRPRGRAPLNNISEEFFEDEEPEDHAINLLGDSNQASDASTAIKALLGEGGDNRASSQLEDDQLVAIFDLLDVGAEMGSDRLLKNAEDFLILRISAKGGTGRQQIVSAFKGLYEPQQGQMGDPNAQPTGSLRGRP